MAEARWIVQKPKADARLGRCTDASMGPGAALQKPLLVSRRSGLRIACPIGIRIVLTSCRARIFEKTRTAYGKSAYQKNGHTLAGSTRLVRAFQSVMLVRLLLVARRTWRDHCSDTGSRVLQRRSGWIATGRLDLRCWSES